MSPGSDRHAALREQVEQWTLAYLGARNTDAHVRLAHDAAVLLRDLAADLARLQQENADLRRDLSSEQKTIERLLADPVRQEHDSMQEQRDTWHANYLAENELRLTAEVALSALDVKWAAASEFIRDVIEAVGKPQPPSEGIVDLPVLGLEVVGQIERYKVEAEAAEDRIATLEQERDALAPILRDMQVLSDAVDEANGTSDYNVRLVALALIARHFLREREAALARATAAPQED